LAVFVSKYINCSGRLCCLSVRPFPAARELFNIVLLNNIETFSNWSAGLQTPGAPPTRGIKNKYMTIDEQIKWMADLPNSGPKLQIINSLRIIEKHFKGGAGDFCIVTMSISDYKAFEEFKQYKQYFKNKQS